MSSIRKRNTPLDPLQKRIPVNSRYKDVKPTIDTGASITKYLQRIEDIKLNYKFSKDEIFKRMKISTFVQLLVQVFKLSCMQDGEDNFNEGDLNSERSIGGGDDDDISTSRSTFVKLSHGVGEMDNKSFNNTNFFTHNPRSSTFISNTIKSHKNNNNNSNNNNNQNNNKHLLIQGDEYYSNDAFSPYLLLDIRPKDDYDLCHITTALSYPKAILSRSVNYESKEMLAFKNKEGKIIVVYDEDEKDAIVVATTLVQRGYDNVFMLSGGLKVALKTFPDGLVTGQPPSHMAPKHRSKQHSKLNHIDKILLNKQNEDMQKEGKIKNNRTLSNKDLNNYVNNNNNDTETTNSTHLRKHSHSTNSLNTNINLNNSSNKLRQEDVDKLEIYLHSQPNSNTETSSRISSRLSTTSKTTTASSSSSRPPFKH